MQNKQIGCFSQTVVGAKPKEIVVMRDLFWRLVPKDYLRGSWPISFYIIAVMI